MKSEGEILLQSRIFQVVRKTGQRPDGGTYTHDVILHPGAAVMLPMVSADQICLIRNFRVAVGETLLELPAGTIDPPEDPAETARRELAEETGYRCGRLEKLCEFFMSPGILRERMHLFLAAELTRGDTAREENEQIENVVVSWDEALRLVDTGQIRDAKTLTGLLYYERLRRKSEK